MEILILNLAVLIEGGFAIFCMLSNSTQMHFRNILRIGAFAVLVMLDEMNATVLKFFNHYLKGQGNTSFVEMKLPGKYTLRGYGGIAVRRRQDPPGWQSPFQKGPFFATLGRVRCGGSFTWLIQGLRLHQL